jgi:anti-anti-sigma regulatory factor
MAQLGLAPSLHDDTGWLVVMGDLTERTTKAVEEAVGRLLESDITSLEIDLRRVTFAAAAAVDGLVALAARSCERGVPVRIRSDAETRRLLEDAQTVALFEAIDTALATASSLQALLEVSCVEKGPPPGSTVVTWFSTDEPMPA